MYLLLLLFCELYRRLSKIEISPFFLFLPPMPINFQWRKVSLREKRLSVGMFINRSKEERKIENILSVVCVGEATHTRVVRERALIWWMKIVSKRTDTMWKARKIYFIGGERHFLSEIKLVWNYFDLTKVKLKKKFIKNHKIYFV